MPKVEIDLEELVCPECGESIDDLGPWEDGDIIQCDDDSCLGALLVEEDGSLTPGESADGEEFDAADDDGDPFMEDEDDIEDDED